MPWISISTQSDSASRAFEDISKEMTARGLVAPEGIMFFTTAFTGQEPSVDKVSGYFKEAYPEAEVVGASAAGVIAGRKEWESGHALTVLVLHDDAVSQQATWLPGGLSSDAVQDRLQAITAEQEDIQGVMLLVDPFSVDIERMLEGFDKTFGDIPIFGGLISGARQSGGHALSIGTQVWNDGALIVTFAGDVSIDVLVAQGCRPIGEPLIITERRGNLVDKLDRGTPLDVLKDIVRTMDPEEQKLAMTSLFAGLNMGKEACVECEGDDFLVRNILGIDPETGSMAIGAIPELYQVMQFYIRDGQTADQDRDQLLGTWADEHKTKAGSVLQFTCLGRGENLFGSPDHDASSAAEILGTEEIGGFFCNGEIGPVGNHTYLHGYSTTFAIFRSKES